MIELRDKDKNRVAGLVDYENLCIESVLESGDKTLSFYYPKKGKYYDEIVEEAYIRTKKDEFVVKARELDEDYTKFECSLNLEELEGNIFDRFESVEQTITSALNLAVVGTGWTVKDNTLKKRRTVRCTNKSSLEIVREIKNVYRVDIVFNTLGKQIEVYEHLGEDKGTYFIDSLNLIALQVQSDSRQYATRIIAEGKDGLSFSDINNGKNYVENYQYSNKVKTIYWKDERYSVKENLLEDARAKLEELSKPFRSYSASILNLAELNPRYSSILDFKLGDAINLISKKNKIKDKQRIVKTIEWPQDHTKDSVELANATLKFEDIQQENQETTDTVSNITTDNGTINGSTIDSIQVKQIENFEANVLKVTKLEVIEASINHLSVIKADIQDLNVVKANIGILEATKANITELNSVRADLQQAIIGKANITDLNAAVGKIHVLESKTASIENALAGNLTAENFKANSIVAGSGIIAEGAIGSAQISSLSVNKLEAGDITTSKHRIVSADGTIEIVGNQILINRNNINRVILGEYRKSDGTTEYGLLVRAKDGQTIMLDGNGVHNAGITDGAIDNNKVADNANISGNKLDINSVIREVNNNGTETIKGTKVTVGDRTLDVELSTQKNTITEHSKELSSQKASLTALDNALKFKVDSQTFTQSTETINSNINRAKEEAIKAAENLALEKSNLAKKYADEVATAKANLAKTEAIANADGKISAEEQKRIQQAQENLNTAISKADKAKQDAIDEANRVAELKKQEAINSANSHADSKANEALNNAKAFVNAEITTVNNKVHNVESNIDILKNKIALKVEQSDIDKTKTELINKINVVDNLANNAKDLASAMSLGKMLFSDPTFKNSSNNIKTYNNNGNGTVTTSRISKINGCPTDSQYCIEVKTVGSASPNHGGFYFGNMTRANAIFVTKIIAKIPVGLRIGWYSNSTGNNGSSKWLTSVNGTGKWEEYIHLLKCGDTGSFSSTSFFALDGGGTPTSSNPIIWHIAYATVFDITENDESVNVLKTEMSTAKNKVAIIETNLDSITQRISSTESKTHSIETTLGGKASKQEVAEVNNRIATIKANLDSITQRVSNTESKTNSLETNINGKASKQELTVVNNKVTEVTASLNGITQRVGNTESRINALDGKVAGAVTLQQFTEFKQSNDKFKFTVEQRSSVSNILPNSSFHGGDRGWLHGGNEFWSGPYSGYGFKGRITGAIKNRAAYNNPERYLQTHKAYKVKKNTTYTINFHYICEKNVQSMDAFVVLSDTEHGDYAQPICVLTAQGGSQSNATEEKPFTYKFNTGNHEWVWIRFDHNGMKSGVNWDEFCWVYVSEIGIYEGDVGAVKWTPKGGEVYSANYQMDGLGFKGTFEDGTYASLGKDGLEWFNAGTGHAYHALTYVTSFDIPIGNPGKAYIKLPAEFTKRRNSLKWTVALRGYYYSTSGDFFPFHIHCTGGRDYIENGLVVCEVQGYCKIQNAQNAGDVQFRPLTAMLIAIA